jgi:hypothetical protein
MKRSKRLDSKKLKKEKIEFWNLRNELPDSRTANENKESGISESVIEHQKDLAKNLQKFRLEYIKKYHKEPDLTDFEMGLIAKYC